MNNHNVSDELLFSYIGSSSFIDNMRHIGRIIKERTKCDELFCFGYNLGRGTLGLLYQDTGDSKPYPFYFPFVPFIEGEALKSVFNCGENLLVRNDALRSKEKEYLLRALNEEYRSAAILYFPLYDDFRQFFGFAALARKAGVLSQDALEVMRAMRQPLQHALNMLNISAIDTVDVPGKKIETNSLRLLKACPDLRTLLRDLTAIAPVNANILINGQTGTGKELMAEAAHELSGRKGKLIKVNCGAIPENLITSELFGYEKGAFTGAVARHAGAFEQAQEGTIFLDEIGELSLSAQVHLLRVIERKEITRVGSSSSIPVNVRIIAATHKYLPDEVQAGRFREDLWYRLNTFVITVPPLSKRKADMAILVRHFYAKAVRDMEIQNPPKLTTDALMGCMLRPWPGNVRQLRNFIERSLLLSHARGQTDLTLMPLAYVEGTQDAEHKKALKNISQEQIVEALEQAGGKIQGAGGAARLLSLSPSTLRYKMKKLGIALPTQEQQ